jgi:hypothetical protein
MAEGQLSVEVFHARMEGLREYLDERFGNIDERITETKASVERINGTVRRLDRESGEHEQAIEALKSSSRSDAKKSGGKFGGLWGAIGGFAAGFIGKYLGKG